MINLLCYELNIDNYTGEISLVGINTLTQGSTPSSHTWGRNSMEQESTAEAKQWKKTLQEFPEGSYDYDYQFFMKRCWKLITEPSKSLLKPF